MAETELEKRVTYLEKRQRESDALCCDLMKEFPVRESLASTISGHRVSDNLANRIDCCGGADQEP
jgi:hypothetical protein